MYKGSLHSLTTDFKSCLPSPTLKTTYPWDTRARARWNTLEDELMILDKRAATWRTRP